MRGASTINGNKLIKEEIRKGEKKIEYIVNNELRSTSVVCGERLKLALSQTNRLTFDLCAFYTRTRRGSVTQEPPRVFQFFLSLFFCQSHTMGHLRSFTPFVSIGVMMMMLSCVVSQFCHYVFNDFSFTRTIRRFPVRWGECEHAYGGKYQKNMGSIIETWRRRI